MPRQVLIVKETDLPKGRTGKYQRNRMAEVLGAEAVDLDAEKALRALNEERVVPSRALHGLRFLVAMWVSSQDIGVMWGRW